MQRRHFGNVERDSSSSFMFSNGGSRLPHSIPAPASTVDASGIRCHSRSPVHVIDRNPPGVHIYESIGSGSETLKRSSLRVSRPTLYDVSRRRPSGIGTMTSQGSAHGRFQRAIQRRNLFQCELAIREMGSLPLLDALA